MRTRNGVAEHRVTDREKTDLRDDPCRSLLSAIMQQAITDIRTYAEIVNGNRITDQGYRMRARMNAKQGWAWLMSNTINARSRITFVLCCDNLDMDPQRIRGLLRQIIGPNAAYELTPRK